MPSISILLPRWIRRYAERDYIDLSLARVLPLFVLIAYGVTVGLVFNTGLDHPWDKVQHLVFFALLTLAIHAFFCCRLRLSAGAAMLMGIAGEGVQAITPHHHASLLDVVANSVGVALVVAIVVLVRSETRAALADTHGDTGLEVELTDTARRPVQASSSRSSSS
ncbi:hypothetical protein [Stappia stellulata]|uniref:hypothetical protein n=1 Tax=Stappia stellulata TaxID=71235 RepID=UPI000418ADFA|nr:hypothetical protein [Stappia stellulata]